MRAEARSSQAWLRLSGSEHDTRDAAGNAIAGVGVPSQVSPPLVVLSFAETVMSASSVMPTVLPLSKRLTPSRDSC
eukprot:2447071-Rhodomonas_salina.1